jgi:hypothetical protein
MSSLGDDPGGAGGITTGIWRRFLLRGCFLGLSTMIRFRYACICFYNL